MNFELIDNFFQIIMLCCAALASFLYAVRYRQRSFLTLALAYTCFMMGTLFFVLHLAIIGDISHVFYVSEISWIASYLFFLSMQLLRLENVKIYASVPAILSMAAVAATSLFWRIMGPSYLVAAVFAFVIGILMYLSVFLMSVKGKEHSMDLCMIFCIILQLMLYISSAFMNDFTRFNLYFAIDIMLTISYVMLLPLLLREVRLNDVH